MTELKSLKIVNKILGFSIAVLFVTCICLNIENLNIMSKQNDNEKLINEITELKKKNDNLSNELNTNRSDILILKKALNNVEVKNIKHGLNATQLRKIIKNIVIYMGEKNISEYTEIILMTALIESDNGYFLNQVKGPALGVFQMEPNTEKCIWENYLKYKPELKKKIVDLMGNDVENLSQLQTNLSYSIAMTYVFYKRLGKKLPDINDKLEMVKFHKKYYNTEKGKSKIDTSLDKIVGLM